MVMDESLLTGYTKTGSARPYVPTDSNISNVHFYRYNLVLCNTLRYLPWNSRIMFPKQLRPTIPLPEDHPPHTPPIVFDQDIHIKPALLHQIQ